MSVLDHPLADRSLELLLERVGPRLKCVFVRFRIPPDDAEDLLQQALLAFIHQSGEVRDPEAWLAGTLRHKCLLYWRNRRRKVYDAVDDAMLEWLAPPQAPDQEDTDLRRDLRQLIERLPPRCRSLLQLRYEFGYEAPELARRLGYRASSIGKITTRCLAALTRHLIAAGLGKERHG
ncbi:MAG: RNA polymerase sigma factor [Thermoanaerobaculia bacterium]